MPKDIRDILKNDQEQSLELSKNHRENFEKRLGQLHKAKTKRNYGFLKIAAAVAVLLSLAYFFAPDNTTISPVEETKIVDLGSVSPEMKQIENYYLTAINYEMASIDANPENQAILDKYLEKIAKLTNDYKQLTSELSERGINEKTINALIDNLQLRLQILLELKDTINEMKTSKTIENEQTTV